MGGRRAAGGGLRLLGFLELSWNSYGAFVAGACRAQKIRKRDMASSRG